MKGIIPLRISGLANVSLTNIKINNINNTSPFGSKECGQYKDSTSIVSTLPGFLGADIRGITVESSRKISFNNVEINGLNSQSGNVIGLDVMFQSMNLTGAVRIQNLTTIPSVYLPLDFSEIPQNVPTTTPIKVSPDSDNINVVQQ